MAQINPILSSYSGQFWTEFCVIERRSASIKKKEIQELSESDEEISEVKTKSQVNDSLDHAKYRSEPVTEPLEDIHFVSDDQDQDTFDNDQAYDPLADMSGIDVIDQEHPNEVNEIEQVSKTIIEDHSGNDVTSRLRKVRIKNIQDQKTKSSRDKDKDEKIETNQEQSENVHEVEKGSETMLDEGDNQDVICISSDSDK